MSSALNSTMAAIRQVRSIQKIKSQIDTAKRQTAGNPLRSLSVMDLVPALNPGYSRPEHLKPMIDAIEEIWFKPTRLTIACSCQVGKTTTLSSFIIATLLRDPTKRIVYVSYSHSQAGLVGRELRELARRAGLHITTDVDSKNEFKLVEGGGVYATSIEGSLTGRALDICIVDDPVKNRGQSRSAAWSQTVDDFYRDVLSTRARSTVSIIIQMARWSRSDLLGKIMDGILGGTEAEAYQYKHIHLPALLDNGQPLWPEQWSLEKLQGLMSDVITWNSLFQCRPLQDGAEIFKSEFKTYDIEALDTFNLYKSLGVDLGYTASKTADSSVAICVGREGEGDSALYYVLDMITAQTSAPQFAQMLKDFQGKHPNTMTRMDAGGSEKGTIAFMTAMPPHGLGIKMNIVNAVQDKVSRALPLSKIWNEGRLLVPVNKLWVPALTEQIIGFTGSGAEHDDIVDALSSAINALIASQPGDRVATSGKTRSTAKGLTGYSEGSMKRARSVW